MITRRLAAAGIMFVFLTCTAWGQLRSLDILGAGARAEGMGGAFIGVADDATALSWNPAGLTQLERPEASFVVRQSFDTYKYSTTPASNFSSTNNHFSFNFGSIAYPFDLGGQRLTAAVAFQNQIDIPLFSDQAGVFKEKQTGGVNTISPGLAYKIIPQLSLGASANIWTGSSKYNYNDIAGAGAGSFSYKDDWSGFNFQAGALAEFSQLRIGASYRSGFTMTDKWNFTDGSDANNYKWEWSLPTMIGIGASYRVGENLIVAVDYDIRAFGKSKVEKVSDNNDPPGTKFNFSASKKNLSAIRIGAEYLIVSESGAIPIRAGFKTVPTLFADTDGSGNYSSQVTGTAISVGTGYIFKKFALDLAVTRKAFEVKDDFVPDNRKLSYITVSVSTIIYF